MPRLQNAPLSTNFEDRTMQSRFEGFLRQIFTPGKPEDQVSGGPQGGYAKWLMDGLQHMSRQDYARMHDQGLTIEQIHDLRNRVKFLPQYGSSADIDFTKLYHPPNPNDLRSYPSDINTYPSLGDLAR